MIGDNFRHLHFSADLAIEFMAIFSRLEYALKSTTYADGTPQRVDAAWDRFANDIHNDFMKLDDEELIGAAKFILADPPRKQVLEDGSLKFKDQIVDQAQRSTQQLLKFVRTIRNNIFHGGKYCPEGEVEAGRNEKLVQSSIKIMTACIFLNHRVAASYER